MVIDYNYVKTENVLDRKLWIFLLKAWEKWYYCISTLKGIDKTQNQKSGLNSTMDLSNLPR